MKWLQHWKVLVALLGLAAVSGLGGGLIGHRIARVRLDERNDPANWNEHVAREFDRLVKPTPEQEPKVQEHLNQAVRELQAIRLETIARSTNVIWRLVGEVERELTPEQRRAFEAMKPKASDLTLDVLRVKPAAGGQPQ
jgi:DNA-binding MarR family transcriptional regulator